MLIPAIAARIEEDEDEEFSDAAEAADNAISDVDLVDNREYRGHRPDHVIDKPANPEEAWYLATFSHWKSADPLSFEWLPECAKPCLAGTVNDPRQQLRREKKHGIIYYSGDAPLCQNATATYDFRNCTKARCSSASEEKDVAKAAFRACEQESPDRYMNVRDIWRDEVLPPRVPWWAPWKDWDDQTLFDDMLQALRRQDSQYERGVFRYTGPEEKLREVERIDAGDHRSLKDVLAKNLPTILTLAVTAYAHLLSKTSNSKRFVAEAIQVVAFVFFPTLPLVQLLNNVRKALLQHVRKDMPRPMLPFFTSGVYGQYVVDPGDKIDRLPAADPEGTTGHRVRLGDVDRDAVVGERNRVSFRSSRWPGRLVLILVNLTLLALTVGAYIKRSEFQDDAECGVSSRRHILKRTSLAALGMDHRLGWLAIGGLVSTVLTLAAHINNRSWEYSPFAALTGGRDQGDDLWRCYAPWEAEVILEIVTAAVAQDLQAVFAMRASLLELIWRVHFHEVGDFISEHWLLSLFVLCLLYWARVSDRLAAFWSDPRKRRRVLQLVLYGLGGGVCLFVAWLELLDDITELVEVGHGSIYCLNYMWKRKDPGWFTL
ncbi:MAG: hypothetical protein M1831_006732 [Alyxoria varia]|nr:MAG: hypothetical protein M1831_006732 [Alyxoria varia]